MEILLVHFPTIDNNICPDDKHSTTRIDRDPGKIPVPAKIGLFAGIPVPVKIVKFTDRDSNI